MSSVKNAWSWFISCILFLWVFLLWKTFKVFLLMRATHEVLQCSQNPFLSFFISFLTSVQCFAPLLLKSGISLLSWMAGVDIWGFITSLSFPVLCLHMAALSNRVFGSIPCLKGLSQVCTMWKRTETNVESNSSLSYYLPFKTQLQVYIFSSSVPVLDDSLLVPTYRITIRKEFEFPKTGLPPHAAVSCWVACASSDPDNVCEILCCSSVANGNLMETDISNDCLLSREKAPLIGEAFNWTGQQVRMGKAV